MQQFLSNLVGRVKPGEAVGEACRACAALARGEEAEVGKPLADIKVMLMGDAEKESDEAIAARVAEAAIDQNLARCVAACIVELPLESMKAAAHILANLSRREGERFGGEAFAEQLVADGFALEALCRAYPENGEVALACGTILREAAKHEIVTAALLKSPSFWLYPSEYVHAKNFDVASDAFEVLRTLLTQHPQTASRFISDNYDFFFECFNRLLHSDNYVTRRESLRLLAELLLDRANYKTMMAYISNRDNLKLLMLLLRSKKQRIQIEAFHVFKIFVANPRKPPQIAKVLFNNKDKLLAYLRAFHNDKVEDQFLEEKNLIIDTLQNLQDPDDDDGAT